MSISSSLFRDIEWEIDQELEDIDREIEQEIEVKRKHKKGYFGIGIYFPSKEINMGSLFRSALAFNADFIFSIGRKYEITSADTGKSPRHLPYFNYKDWDDFYSHLPIVEWLE